MMYAQAAAHNEYRILTHTHTHTNPYNYQLYFVETNDKLGVMPTKSQSFAQKILFDSNFNLQYKGSFFWFEIITKSKRSLC